MALSGKDLLLLLLYAPASEGGAKNVPISGRTRLSKLVFLFEKEVLPFDEFDSVFERDSLPEFFSWKFGPFSKEVYDDIDFFRSIDFIEAQSSAENPAASPAEAFEMSYWVDAESDDDASTETEASEYSEETFTLTDIGAAFVEDKGLWEGLSGAQREALIELKNTFIEAPLYMILKYVYKNYPDTIEKSEIADQVLR